VFPVFADPVAVEIMVTEFVKHITTNHGKVDVILGLDARGFLLGPMIATRLGCKFAPVRKAGKVENRC
jgi:adenine phosphoribosyltransferase